MSQRAVVLVGPMGSGKSTVGRALARRLEVGHVDTDDMVSHRAGRSIAEIFETDGEAAFREMESAALAEALAGPRAVISTGGGVVVAAVNRALLAESDALVVWLDGSIDALADRVGSGRGRPLLEGDVRETLKAKIAQRAPGYLEVADVRVDTSQMRHEDCVDAIVAALEGVTA
jgi:shikimate kinase